MKQFLIICLFLLAGSAQAQLDDTAPAPLPDNQYTHLNSYNQGTTGPGDASTYCPGAVQDITGTPSSAAPVGTVWTAANTAAGCGPEKSLQNTAGYGVWAPLNAGLPLDTIGAPASAITVTGAGSGYAVNDLVYFAHGTVGIVVGGTSTTPTLSLVTGYAGNWGCVSTASQTGVSQTGTTGSGTGATYTITTPLPIAYGVKLLTTCYAGHAATLTAFNGTAAESTKDIPFVGGTWDQVTADGYCGQAAGFTAVATWSNAVNAITLNSANGVFLPGDTIVSLDAPGIDTTKFVANYSDATHLTINGTTSAAGTSKTVLINPPSYAFAARTCYVTTWNDQSGQTFDVTQATVQSAPIYLTQRMFNGLRPVVFDGAFHNPPALYDKWLSNNSGSISYNLNNMTVIMVGRVQSSRETRGLFGPTSDTSALYTSGSSDKFSTGSTFAIPANSLSRNNACRAGPSDSYAVFGISTDATNQYCFNGSATNTHNIGAFSEAVTGATIGTSVLTQNGSVVATGMDVLAVIMYPYKLSTTQQQAIVASLSAYFRVPTQYNDILISDGDSLYMAGSVLGNTIPFETQPLLARPALQFNTALSGSNIATGGNALYNLIAKNECWIWSSYGGANAKNFIVDVLAGANDIRSGTAVATIEAGFQTFSTTLKACAPNAKFMLATYPLQADIQANPTWLAALQALNAWIKANYNIPVAQGGAGGDCLADYYAEPTVGGSSGTSAFNSPPNAIAVDTQHFQDNGAAYMAGVRGKAYGACRR